MKKIILGLVIVLGLSFFAVGSIDAEEGDIATGIQYEEGEILSNVKAIVENLSIGMISDEVKELQQKLSQDTSIYPQKLITGYFGLLTKQAVKRFQAKKGLLQTGIVDKYLRQLIWDAEPELAESVIAKISCDDMCKREGYDYGICRETSFLPASEYGYIGRIFCKAGEKDIGHTAGCYVGPGPEIEKKCCCGNNATGYIPPPIFRCTDSDGGIMKYVQGTTCQPSRIIRRDDTDSGITRSFCKTDRCIDEVSVGPIPSGTERTKSFVLEYYCRNGVMMSKQIECENGCKNGACLKVGPEPVCTPEGVRQHIGDPVCCDGLIQIGNDFVDSTGICNGIDDGSHYCAKCGNEICGSGENKCNCPEDCEGVCHKDLNKEECESFGGEYKCAYSSAGSSCYCECPCKTDSDCWGNRCGSGRCIVDGEDAYCCYEHTYECVNGKCEHEKKEYKGYTCSHSTNKCSDTCGDGVCKFPETQWWCPEDCKGCVGDGEVKTPLSECCEGLHVIASGYRNNISYCTSEICGNGKCQALENEWNCKQDCKKQTVDIQPVINMIKQAIEKLNLAIRMLGNLNAIPVESEGGTASSSGGGGGTE